MSKRTKSALGEPKRFGVAFKVNDFTLAIVYFDTEWEAKAHADSFVQATAATLHVNGSASIAKAK